MIPKHNEKITNIKRTLVLAKPEYLKINNSSLSIILIKKNCVEIKKMNGSASKIIDGALRKDKNKGKKVWTSRFLKKVISSNKFTINTRLKKIKVISIKFLENEVSIYLLYVLKIID